MYYIFFKIIEAFVPPKPKLLDKAILTDFCFAILGTKSIPCHDSETLSKLRVGGIIPVCIVLAE
jgi:hypothetical protein